MIPWTDELVTTLMPHEVFVFGSNSQGFHGAGAAGLAMRGDARNNWRQDKAFLKAIKAPVGHPDRVGQWACYGQAKGYQAGKLGLSYAIITVTKPGAKRSIPRREIYDQLLKLWTFAIFHIDLSFLIPPLGEGYAGWTQTEMAEVWEFLIKTHRLPENIRFIGRKAGVSAT